MRKASVLKNAKPLAMGLLLPFLMLAAPVDISAGTDIGAEDYHQLLLGYSDSAEQPSSLAVGDFDGDGIDDLAIGVRYEDYRNVNNTGIVSVFYGASDIRDLPDPAFVRQDEDVYFYGGAENDCIGFIVAAGDLNNDDIDDLVVMAQQDSDYENSKIYVLYGPLGSENALLSNEADVEISRDDAAYFAAMAVGDMNHDGIDDLVIADVLTGILSEAPYHVSRKDVGPHGAVYAVFGKTVALPGTIDLDSTSVLTITRDSDTEAFQAYSLAIGDVNGDDYGDLAIGAPKDDGIMTSLEKAGRIHVVFGKDWGTTTAASIETDEDVVIYGAVGGDRIGGWLTSTSVAAHPLDIGDVNDDEVGDLIIGAPDSGLDVINGASIGKVDVVFGDASLSNKDLFEDFDLRLLLEDSNDSKNYTGYAVSVADVNCDGVGDIVASSARAYLAGGVSHSSDGAVFAVLGNSSLSGTKYLTLNGESYDADFMVFAPTIPHILGGGHMGSNLAIGDLNDNQSPDLVMGAPKGYTDNMGWSAFFFDPLCTEVFVSLDGVCGGKFPCHVKPQDGENKMIDGAVMKIAQGTYTGDLEIDFSYEIPMQGGWNSSFTQIADSSVIDGMITITGGPAVFENIAVQ